MSHLTSFLDGLVEVVLPQVRIEPSLPVRRGTLHSPGANHTGVINHRQRLREKEEIQSATWG